MELRTSDTTHFIQTIKDGLVQKVCNKTSNGRPLIRSKLLKDVYGSEDAKGLQNPPSGLVFDHQQADRTLREIKPEIGEFSTHADDDFGRGSDDDTTLKQLKKRLLTKKRKRILIDDDSQKDDEIEKAAQDDSDLNEPLVNWKSKHSTASKAKRKRLKVRAISYLNVDIAIKSEENLVSECSPQIGGEPAPVSRVKVEYPDTEPLGLNDVSNLGQKRVLNEYNTEPPLCVNISETCVTNQINYDALEDDVPMSILFSRDGTSPAFKTLESACGESLEPSVEVEKQREIQDLQNPESACRESLEPSLEVEKQRQIQDSQDLCNHSGSSSISEDSPEERCISGTQVPDIAINGCVRFHQECNPENKHETVITNEPNDLEDDVPMSILFSRDGTSPAFKTLESACGESLKPSMEVEKQREIQDSQNPESACRESEEPSLEVEKQRQIQDSQDLCNHSRSSSISEDSPEERCISGTQVPDIAINGCVRFHKECNPENKNEAVITNEPSDSQSSLDNNCGPHLVSISPSKTIADKEQPSTEDESVKAVEKQSSALTIQEASLENMTCGGAETVFSLKAHQPSERLLSSRKAFAPSSQEQLRLAMKSDEVCNDSNRNIVLECKEKLFENQNEKNDPSPRSKVVSRRKVPTGPRHIVKKLAIAKGNLEGPRFSRTLPNVSSASSSVQGCTEGAIAFSQRQMQDMETLAEKLMKELKSMKDIVEQKLLFEAYRNASLKNDADEVKLAITNATKAEDMGKRWMSMIARDCTRFCKIMKLTLKRTPASKDNSPREKRKIRFADEAGGQLCHVKYFDDGVAAPEADSDATKEV